MAVTGKAKSKARRAATQAKNTASKASASSSSASSSTAPRMLKSQRDAIEKNTPKPDTIVNSKGKTLYRSESGNSYNSGVSRGLSRGNATASYTPIAGPNAGKRVTLYSGGSKTVKSPQLSTTQYRRETTENQMKYDQFKTRVDEFGRNTTTSVTGYKDNPDGTTTLTLDDGSQDVGTYKKNADGTYDFVSNNQKKDPFADLNTDEANFRRQAAESVKSANATFDKVQKYADKAHRNLISATKEIYQARLDKMANSNMRVQATRGVSNIRQGRDRYAPEMAAGIITDEELSGHERLSEIEGNMLLAIANADKAKAEGDFKAYNDHIKNVNDIIGRMDDQIKQNFEMAVARDKAVRDEEKATRDAEKQEFEMMTKRASTAAPAIASKLKGYSEAEQMAFLEEYSKQTGVDIDILMGEIELAEQKNEKSELDIANIKNQIYNRDQANARGWAAEARQQRKADEEDDVDDATKNVITGAQTLDELTGEARTKVTTDLRELGYYSSTPPEWFIDMKNEESSATVEPTTLRTLWEEHRQSIVSGGL